MERGGALWTRRVEVGPVLDQQVHQLGAVIVVYDGDHQRCKALALIGRRGRVGACAVQEFELAISTLVWQQAQAGAADCSLGPHHARVGGSPL